MLDNAIISMIITASTGLLLALFRYSFLSKCNKIELCGLKIHRNTEQELQDIKNTNTQNVQMENESKV